MPETARSWRDDRVAFAARRDHRLSEGRADTGHLTRRSSPQARSERGEFRMTMGALTTLERAADELRPGDVWREGHCRRRSPRALAESHRTWAVSGRGEPSLWRRCQFHLALPSLSAPAWCDRRTPPQGSPAPCPRDERSGAISAGSKRARHHAARSISELAGAKHVGSVYDRAIVAQDDHAAFGCVLRSPSRPPWMWSVGPGGILCDAPNISTPLLRRRLCANHIHGGQGENVRHSFQQVPGA